MAIIDNDLFTQTNPSANSPRNNPSLAGEITNLNNEMNSVEDTLVQGYVRESASVSYSSSSSFTVSGNKTDIYTAGRIVRFSDGTTGIVSSSYFYPPNTTVEIINGTVPSALSYIDISLQPKGGTNQFLKASGSDINTGTEDAKIVTPKAIADSNVVFTNKTQTITNKTFQKTIQTIVTATDGPTVTFDLSQGNIQKVTLGGNRTLAVSNVSVGQAFIIRLTQDSTGSRTVTWWSGISWVDGSPPTLTTTPGKTDVFGFLCTGTNTYDGYIVGQNI